MIYEYLCPSCGARNSESLPVCMRDEPMLCACGSAKTRLVSMPCLVLHQDCNLEPDDIALRLEHKAEIEKDMAKDNFQGNLKLSGPSEFQPKYEPKLK